MPRPSAFVLVAALAVAPGGCKDRASDRASGAARGASAAPEAVAARAKAAAAPRAWTRPPTPPSLPTAATAWTAAETANTADAWDGAAAAYERERDACTRDCLEPTYAVLLARRNALMAEAPQPPPGDAPVPLPPRAQAALDAMDAFVAASDPADPDHVGVKFLAGNLLRRWRQPDALERLEEVLRAHRDHETAEYAANLLLDQLLREGRVAEVRALVEELLADAAFLAGKDDLRATLLRVQQTIAAAP